MKPDLLIKGGRIIDPSQKTDTVADLLISQGNIAILGTGVPESPRKSVSIFDATGLIVCPGFIDLHCHLREPGFEDKETIATGTRAAAAGGFTTICCMPNTNPPLDNKATVDYVKIKAESEGLARVLCIGCITKGRQGEELTEMYELAEAGVIGFSDDGAPVANSRLMYLAMEYSKLLNLPIMEHCEDKDLTDGGFMNEGWVSAQMGLKGMPSAAEEIAIARDIALAKLTGSRLHITHVTTEGSVDLISNAKEKGLAVTAEVTPHHLTLTDERVMGPLGDRKPLRYDTNAKVNPPLRTQNDIDALIKGLKDGTIDAIATDHAPHTTVEKLCEFGFASFGISGFETAFGSLASLVHSNKLDINTLIAKLTCEPSQILGNKNRDSGTLKIGSKADITILDLNREWAVDSRNFFSKGKNTPYDGYKYKGKVVATFLAGNLVYQDSTGKIEGK
jgi:dihydroorotase